MRSIEQLDLGGKRTFIRVDFNVPLRDGKVSDSTRIDNSLPTIRHARESGARVVLASHLGRPKGQVRAEYSLAPVGRELSTKLDAPVTVLDDCVGEEVRDYVAGMAEGDIVLLENLRFHAEEEANDADFSRSLGALADVYVNDAFGTAHRAHASTAGIVAHVDECAAGCLMLREVDALSGLLDGPRKPFVAILGGAKVSDKIQLIANLLDKVDSLVIGGAMAYTFLKAQGTAVGSSRIEEDRLDLARELLKRTVAAGVRMELPSDHVVAAEFSENATAVVTAGAAIDAGMMGLDIGPATEDRYAAVIAEAATVFWNGPMGVFEWPAFSRGTMRVANAVADSPALSVVGGGDSVAALHASGRSADVGHISTGGGASLELLEGKQLPGLAALDG